MQTTKPEIRAAKIGNGGRNVTWTYERENMFFGKAKLMLKLNDSLAGDGGGCYPSRLVSFGIHKSLCD